MVETRSESVLTKKLRKIVKKSIIMATDTFYYTNASFSMELHGLEVDLILGRSTAASLVLTISH